jgi:1,4-dihydroxy-2-naphthoate octaprenyltransferase
MKVKKAWNAASRSRAATVPIAFLVSVVCVVAWRQHRSSSSTAVAIQTSVATTALQRHVNFVREVSDEILGNDLRSTAAERKQARLEEFGYVKIKK